MESYIGTKIIKGEPMTKNTFDEVVKWVKVQDGIPDIEGYKVVFEDGYTSWSPKDAFERCYRKITLSEQKLINNEQ